MLDYHGPWRPRVRDRPSWEKRLHVSAAAVSTRERHSYKPEPVLQPCLTGQLKGLGLRDVCTSSCLLLPFSPLPPRSLLFSLQLVDLKAALFRKQAEFKQEKLSHDSSTQPVRKQVSEKVANPEITYTHTRTRTHTHMYEHIHTHKPTHLDCLHMAERISGSGQEGQERPYYCQ